MSKNRNKVPMTQQACPTLTPDLALPAATMAATTKDPAPTDADRQLRILAGLGLYALGLVAAFGGAATGRKMQGRGLDLLGIPNQPTLTATAAAILAVVDKEWGV